MAIIAVLFFFCQNSFWAQCDQEVCNSNAGIYSDDHAEAIAYDNMGSAFHSTFIRQPNSGWKVWGEKMHFNGIDNMLSPIDFNAVNYPGLTGEIYKMAIGSRIYNGVQLIVLTASGLFVLGTEDIVLNGALTTSSAFQKLTIAGNITGLPPGITPEAVKMLFATTGALILTTCHGNVYILAKDNMNLRGSGTTGSPVVWAQVMQDAATPLTDIIAARTTVDTAFALKSDGTAWTWGDTALLGDGNASQHRNYATQMTLPGGIPGIKMIQITTHYETNPSYFILGTDKKVYGLGSNGYGGLGDQTDSETFNWVNAKNPDGLIITDAAWISVNEHDYAFPGLAVINTSGSLLTAGSNSDFMIGRTTDDNVNFLALPNGIAATDVITNAEVGGHATALIKQNTPRYGYVGHRINGSMGDGTTTNAIQQAFDFVTPPVVAVCGTLCAKPIVSTNSPICPGTAAIFTITGTPGDAVSYTINEGTVQTAVINASGSVLVTVYSVRSEQKLQLIHVLGAGGNCSNNLSSITTINPETLYCGMQKGISPNGDTLNDYFDLRSLNASHLNVFNRYGVRVYSKRDYRDEWKGQTDNGNKLPDGIYYYVIEFKTEPTKTGWIYLNKEK